MADEQLFQAAPAKAFAISSTQALLSCPDGTVMPVMSVFPQALLLCSVPRTLPHHEAAVQSQLRGASQGAASEIIRALVQAHLLIPVPEVTASALDSIKTVGILSTGNVDLVRRCLESLSEEVSVTGDRLKAFVVDLSGVPAPGMREMCEQLVGDVEAVYYGQRQYDVVAGTTTRSWLSWMADGRRRHEGQHTPLNEFLLASAGSRVLIASESTRWRAWTSGAANGVTLAGHSDLRTYDAFTTRGEALAVTGNPGTVLKEHNRVLGRELRALLREHREADLQSACSHLRNLLADGVFEARVRVTLSGVAGDGGLRSMKDVLLSTGIMRDRLRRDRELFDRASMFREMHRIAETVVVTHEPTVDANCSGLDNESLLPPFLPMHGTTIAAACWSRVLQLTDPGALAAHLPCGVLSDPARDSEYGDEFVDTMGRPTVSELVDVCVSSCGLSSYVTSAAERMQYVGLHLTRLASLPFSHWQREVRESLSEHLAGLLQRLDQFEGDMSPYPAYWRAAFARYRVTLLANMDAGDFMVPHDLGGLGSNEDVLKCVQAIVGAYGEMLLKWPAIWQTAQLKNASYEATPCHR